MSVQRTRPIRTAREDPKHRDQSSRDKPVVSSSLLITRPVCSMLLSRPPLGISEKYSRSSARDPGSLNHLVQNVTHGLWFLLRSCRRTLPAVITCFRSPLWPLLLSLGTWYLVIRAGSTFLQPEAFIPNGFSQCANLRANLRDLRRSIENLSRDVGSWRVRARNVRSNIFETLRISEYASSRGDHQYLVNAKTVAEAHLELYIAARF